MLKQRVRKNLIKSIVIHHTGSVYKVVQAATRINHIIITLLIYNPEGAVVGVEGGIYCVRWRDCYRLQTKITAASSGVSCVP